MIPLPNPCPATTTDLGAVTRCILAAGHADEQHFDGAILWRDRAVARDVPPRLPHEWPADPRDPLVCTHGCGCEPGDVLIEDECPRRLRVALEGAVLERDRLRVAARGVIAVWDGEYEDDRMAPKIDKLRDALAGREKT